ncbi:MAG: Gfo/Idh/MocA family oxidoreductase [Armatimonadetes bacterium]|nr:Gfo/Idh/MocA family oxidoreductase [Armatimonadota bacterium]MDW8120802.1 Gfo/Idh/MocA family oxidoreductase [Armatimonadota bacterium]
MPEGIKRRDFFKTAITTGLTLGMGPLVLSERVKGANDRIGIGIIGPGQRGWTLMQEAYQEGKRWKAEMVAVCDVWRRNLERAAAQVHNWYGTKPLKFVAHEDLLASDQVDAVIIATADFQHARHLIDAMKAGKDAYCEKPMANDLDEANECLRVWQKTQRVVQIGTQRRSDGHAAAAAEFLANNPLGVISRVECHWHFFGPRWRRPQDVREAVADPSAIDWRRFLMNKPWRPFDPHRFLEWRLYRDYSSGLIDQWMSHTIDLVHWLTGERFPSSVTAQGGVYLWKDGRENPDAIVVALEYPKGFLCTFSASLTNGAGGSGIFIRGSRGSLDTNTWTVTGEGAGDDRIKELIKINPKSLPNHMSAWLEAVRNRKQPNCTVEHGYYHSVACILATEALWSGKRTGFDPAKRKIRSL